MNIYQRINAIHIEGKGYLKKGSAGQGTGVLFDEVMASYSKLFAKHGVMVVPNLVRILEPRFTPEKNNPNGATTGGMYISGAVYDINYVNIDDPKDKIVNRVTADAMDAGDKAPGKGITYATKISMVKILLLETGTNDESRGDEESRITGGNLITAQQFSDIKEKLEFHLQAFKPEGKRKVFAWFRLTEESFNKGLVNEIQLQKINSSLDYKKKFEEILSLMNDDNDKAAADLFNQYNEQDQAKIYNWVGKTKGNISTDEFRQHLKGDSGLFE